MVEYAVKINQTVFTELTNVQASTTINPFGDRYICEFRDTEGNQFDEVDYTDPVVIFARDPTAGSGSATSGFQKDRSYNNIAYNETTLPNDFESIFEGYVVQSDGGEEGGRDILTVTVYSFDQIIRNERVSNDQSGNSISTALENIIKEDTPVAFVSGNVSVGDDRVLNRPLQGLTVEEALRVLSLRSENENYGVNDNREFFFRQRVETSGEKDITDGDVTNYDIPERGKETKNQVTVNYNSDNERVTVSNGSDQLNVQDSLNTQDPVGFPDEISRPSITDRQEAFAEGREFLRQRESTLAGRVTVVGDTDFLSNEVGDTVNVTITPRGIDDEFVLVGKEVDYLRNEITFDIIQKRGDQDSLLKAIGQQLKREELSDTDQGTQSDIVTQTEIRADITQSYSGVNTQIKRVTTTCRNQLREAWLSDESVEIATAVLGDGDTVRRADTSVPNIVDTSSVSLGTNGSDSLDVSFSLTGTGNILGFRDTDGDLLFIALIDETTDPSGTLTVTINDGDTDKSVLTNTGQEAIRDLFRGTSSLIPDRVEYGNNDELPQESDTTINTQISKQYSAERLSADSTTEWENNTSIAANKPAFIENGFLKAAQPGFVAEAENLENKNSNNVSDSDASNGEAEELQSGLAQFLEFNFTCNYDIPANEWGVIFRSKFDSSGTQNNVHEVLVDSNTVEGNLQSIGGDGVYEWVLIDNNNGFELTAGSHTVEIDVIEANDNNSTIDLIGLIDTRFYSDVSNFDNTLNSSSGYLADPKLYPQVVEVAIDTLSTIQQLKSADLTTDYNNTDNGQFVELSDGQTQRNNNSETASLTGIETRTINALLGLDGFGTRTDGTPTEKFNGQEVDFATIDADLAVLNKSDVGRADYEVVFGGSEANGVTLIEGGQVNANGDALTRSIFPELTPSGEAVILSEDLGFDL